MPKPTTFSRPYPSAKMDRTPKKLPVRKRGGGRPGVILESYKGRLVVGDCAAIIHIQRCTQLSCPSAALEASSNRSDNGWCCCELRGRPRNSDLYLWVTAPYWISVDANWNTVSCHSTNFLFFSFLLSSFSGILL
ncbi:hypothetical protein O181_056685 [Austropuccinia psidii MF-1]|uniref:Uncharacterized protein n=1 Tax=Austropuccinia psidii MF-1 TaxID=1389203 RepID=A0A9Q3HWB3_9BASI|nr:hypothetical protein [Austropuccinia psidii MF-1]